MTGLSFIWIVVFALAALFFFGTATVITVLGARDLRDLLRGSGPKKQERV